MSKKHKTKDAEFDNTEKLKSKEYLKELGKLQAELCHLRRTRNSDH